jgi:hypothetical protein
VGLVALHGRMTCYLLLLLGGTDHLAYSEECTSVMQMHRLLYDGDDGLGGRAKHMTAMKRVTNVQALVNCTVAMKRVPSKLEALL